MAPRALEAPAVLRRAWGDEVTDALTLWLSAVLEERAISRDEYRQILSRLDILEHDLSGLKAEVYELRREMREEINELRREMNERFDRVNERMDRMYHQMVVQTRWLVGTITVIGALITLLLAIGQFIR